MFQIFCTKSQTFAFYFRTYCSSPFNVLVHAVGTCYVVVTLHLEVRTLVCTLIAVRSVKFKVK